MAFVPLEYQDFKVGRRVKGSKKKHLWRFELDGKECSVELFDSRMSGKRKILLNGEIKVDKKGTYFNEIYSMFIRKHRIEVIEISDGVFDLACDKALFSTVRQKQNDENKNTRPTERPLKVQEEYVTKVKIPIIHEDQKESLRETGKEPEITRKKDQAPQIDLLDDTTYTMGLPDDLFKITVPDSSVMNSSQNPFEEPARTEEKMLPSANGQFDLFDLDNLHLGDKYSPAVMKKIEEANRPVTIEGKVADVPMNEIHVQNQGLPSNFVNNNVVNPMAAMMAYNQFVTGMMTQQWMQRPNQY